MNGWEHICLDCWQEEHPDDYAPRATDIGECDRCGEYSMTVGVRTDDA